MRKLIALLLASILLVACAPQKGEIADPIPYKGTGEKKVAVIGDSITLLAAGGIEQKIQEKGYRVYVDSTLGITTDQSLPVAQKIAPGSPNIVVFNLGTNDVAQGLSLPSIVSSYSKLVDNFPHSCVIIATITQTNHPDIAEPLNKLIRSEKGVRNYFGNQNIHVMDWESVLQGHPEYVPDGVHPANDGLTVYTDLVSNSLDKCA